ncbi:hypothetical protein Salat_2152200 [Sesamum alatum]|uniref:Reverse transcriptase domain-containing protein n=1 Tax=Sesamum alatum TaxID=300844 RepID=A0AAE2CH88_9LAMI|nr:hypothetical protein Salat_2152200 [Sesamum alatum]
MRKNEKRQRSSRYCDFHKDREHTTEECRPLRDKIERFTRMGYIKEVDQFAINEKGKRKRRTEEELSPQENDIGPQLRRRIVNVIEGGGYGGFTRSARKRHAPEMASGHVMGILPEGNDQGQAMVLTFTEEDRRGIRRILAHRGRNCAALPLTKK